MKRRLGLLFSIWRTMQRDISDNYGVKVCFTSLSGIMKPIRALFVPPGTAVNGLSEGFYSFIVHHVEAFACLVVR